MSIVKLVVKYSNLYDMRFLSEFPIEITVVVLSQWLNIIDLCHLDSSTCNKRFRSFLFYCFDSNNMILTEPQPEHVFQKRSSLEWIVSRNIKLSHFYIVISCLSYDLITRLSTRDTLSYIKTLTVSTLPENHFVYTIKEFDLEAIFITFINLCTHLESLDCKNLEYLTDRSLIKISENCNIFLKYLNIHSCDRIDDNGIESIAKNCFNLININLNNCKNLTDKSLELLGICCKNLNVIHISGCYLITDIGLIYIIKGCTFLKQLDISCNGSLSCVSMIELSNCSIYLEHLNVSECNRITERGLNKILSKCQLLQYLNVSSCTGILYHNLLVQIILYNLTFISFSGCESIHDTSLIVIMSKCPYITHLDVSFCHRLTDEAIKELIQTSLLMLKSINLMSCIKISDESVILLITYCKELLKIDLCSCKSITNHSFSTIYYKESIHCILLENLNLSYCRNITNEGLLNISKLLLNLQCISISSSISITNIGIISILQACKQLNTIVLSGCICINDATLLYIAQECSKNLISLDITDCYQITDEGLMELSHHCTNLQYLYALGCGKITNNSIFQITRRCIHLKHMDISLK